MIWVAFGALLIIGLIWALTPALSAFAGSEGFIYWPPCPNCGNIAVSCIRRYPANSSPARAYTLACDHGCDAPWPGTGFCGLEFTRTHAEIVSMQPELAKGRS